MSVRTDTQLHKNVVDELAFEPWLDASKVAVAVKDGVVTLSGSVPNYTAKWATEKAVKRVHGVLGVAEELTVRSYPDSQHTDRDVAEAARQALEWNVATAAENIQIKVESGWVTLEGQVEWQYQRQSAQAAVAHLLGVKGMINLLTLSHRASPTDVHARIEEAFKRATSLDANQVQVEAEGGSVTLRGSLPSWGEIDAAGLSAWSVAGVTSVNNQISIRS
ncbi:BON domain-containing protein [Deinococcus sp. UYEF24]